MAQSVSDGIVLYTKHETQQSLTNRPLITAISHDKWSGCAQAIGTTAWNNVHGLSYHTYQTSLSGIQSDLNSLYSTYGKPIWVTEIADGSGSSMAANQQLMTQFVQWAASRTWIERIFWNQAVRV